MRYKVCESNRANFIVNTTRFWGTRTQSLIALTGQVLIIGNYNLSYDMTQEVFIKMMKNLNSFKKINMDNTRERNSIKANDV